MQTPPEQDRDAPQLRTLLLTDLCDSTSLVERIGDLAAADLFREHDRLVLELQQRWRGRLIDRSDGLLLLFERPIDGLGFALDYRHGLDDLGRSQGVGPLLARAGLHVGEVLIWRNSDEAVDVGAKPVEIEGLAKPFAARLMQLALPGQILVSAVAEPLVRRAARELGERGQELKWRSYGRWRFKGVPTPFEIHEVGEAGLAPLRTPRSDGKAWRDVPLWRRPIALAAEIAAVAVLGAGIWLATRAEPAIAFNERDWVVVGDLRNLTGQTVLDESLEQAFRISLEQSRYVNVLSELKVEKTLRLMGEDPRSAVLDKKVGGEVAIRDGARLLLLPVVSEVGGRVRVSVEVVDPNNSRTLLVRSADGIGMTSVLHSIDTVVADLRDRLGESFALIRHDYSPLPDMATPNLDALRAYALGQKSHAQGRYDESREFLEQAVQLDPNFALAHIGVMRSHNALADADAGAASLDRAMELRDRLPPRDQLYLDAWYAEINAPQEALSKWKMMLTLYPDFFPASVNVGFGLRVLNRYDEALSAAEKSVAKQSEYSAISWNLVGMLRLAKEDYIGANDAFNASIAAGSSVVDLGNALSSAMQRDFVAADEFFSLVEKSRGVTHFDRVSMLLDQGETEAASQHASNISDALSGRAQRWRASLFPVAVAAWADGDIRKARFTLKEMAETNALVVLDAASSQAMALEASYALAAAGLFAAKIGENHLSEKSLNILQDKQSVFRGTPVDALLVALRASSLLDQGKSRQAVALLSAISDGTEPLQVRAMLVDALISSGDYQGALENAQWLAGHRGRAYTEQGCAFCQQPLNVHQSTLMRLVSAELLATMGQKSESLEELRQFDAAWPVQKLPDHLRSRRDALL